MQGSINGSSKTSARSLGLYATCLLKMLHLCSMMIAFMLLRLKTDLTSAPIIRPPIWSVPFEIMCDASDYALGAVLGQRIGKLHHVIYIPAEL